MKPHYGVAALALMAATLVACGGGGGATPFVGPPQTASNSIPLSTTATTTATLPAIANGSSATVTFPVVSNAANATVTLCSLPPTGASAPQAKSMAKKAQNIGGTLTPLDYLVVSVDNSVSITQTPAFSFMLASTPPAVDAYIAELHVNNASSGWNLFLGPGKVSGNTISFSAQTLAPPFTLKAGDTYVFALVVAASTITPPPPTTLNYAVTEYHQKYGV